MAAILPVVQRPCPAAPAEAVELTLRQVLIQSANTVNIYTTRTGRDAEDGDGQIELPSVR